MFERLAALCPGGGEEALRRLDAAMAGASGGHKPYLSVCACDPAGWSASIGALMPDPFPSPSHRPPTAAAATTAGDAGVGQEQQRQRLRDLEAVLAMPAPGGAREKEGGCRVFCPGGRPTLGVPVPPWRVGRCGCSICP